MHFQGNGERHNIFVAAAFIAVAPSAFYYVIAMAFYDNADFVLALVVFALTFVCVVGLFYVDILATIFAENSRNRALDRAQRNTACQPDPMDDFEEIPEEKPAPVEEKPKEGFAERVVKIDGEERRWLFSQDPKDKAWRDCCIRTLLWAHHYGGLGVSCLVGKDKIFSTPGQWGRAMLGLEAGGIVNRQNGVGTFVTDGWTYGRAINFLQSGGSIPWPEGVPPEVKPYVGDRSPRPVNLETVTETPTSE